MKNHLRAAKVFAILLDNRYSLFGIKFGLDPILDLVPGLGTITGAILSLYLVWIAYQIDLPSNLILKILKNIAIDFIIGILPLVGPIADIFYKSNLKNLKILEEFNKNLVQGEIII